MADKKSNEQDKSKHKGKQGQTTFERDSTTTREENKKRIPPKDVYGIVQEGKKEEN